jgi:putative addiction module component (TIGR02574 family)
MSAQEILAAILRLPPDQRQDVIHQAIESLPEDDAFDEDMTPELQAKLDRRLDEYLHDPSKGRSWAQVNARIEGTLHDSRSKLRVLSEPRP